MSDRARPLGLAERLEVETAVEAAFAPLRTRRATSGPTRVRAAVRWGRGRPEASVPWAGPIRRLSELGIAVGMSAFVFAASLTATAVLDPTSLAPRPSSVVVVGDLLAPHGRVLPPGERPVRPSRPAVIGPAPIQDRLDPAVPVRAQVAPSREPGLLSITMR